ncbi:MAG TPA: type II secretion system F family protein [Microthrixaceae bacterium]|jgi:tight adherence protein C|nr:type II secretion system F family protein [Microthrixaceae bacterium]
MTATLLLPVLLIAVAVGAVVFTVLSQLDERQMVRESLRQLDGYEVENQRDQQLLDPLKDRAIKPVLEGLTGLGKRFTPVGYVDKVRQKFVHMGNTSPQAVDRFLAVRAVTVVLAVVVFLAVFVVNLTPFEGNLRLGVGALLILGLLLGPDSILNRKVEERQLAIQRALPDILDLLTISVEAGLGFEQAVDRVITAVPGPLSDEFSRMLGETRAGAARADAMRAMDERCDVPDLRAFVLAIIQADTFGVSIGRVLRSQSQEMRIKRRQLAQERAQKAPVKMLFPMVFCIFPALFVVILGPAILSIMDTF